MMLRLIPEEECEDRRVYKIKSRNLRLGVFRKETGVFVGLRTKFGHVYAFSEIHWDHDGTVRAMEPLDEFLPVEIPLCELMPGALCGNCGKPVAWDQPYPQNPRWVHVNPGECCDILPHSIRNDALEEFLTGLEKKYFEAEEE